MAIELGFEKINDGEDTQFKLVSVKALTKEGLPEEYINDEPCTYPIPNGIKGSALYDFKGNRVSSYVALFINDVYTKDEFNAAIDYLTACGDRLRRINAKLKKVEENKIVEQEVALQLINVVI
ncbi:MAG: hypothetical protein M0R51_14220 [Clostridia bacterium]|jgi:hypothetical protein|nr:hypothetical protein [Clostridia bacterium]